MLRGYLVKGLLAALVYQELLNGDLANLMPKTILYKNFLEKLKSLIVLEKSCPKKFAIFLKKGIS